MADIFNIAGEINSTSQEGTAVHANQVKDDLQNKKQSQINEEVGEELELHTNRLNAITGQNYITVQATQSITAADIPTLINATGEGEQVDTLYRVGFWDGSAYVADKYTEYAWNGTAYVILDVKSSIGDVFDISQYNAVGGTLATYADLTAALGASGANVPASIRTGGMSVKFVQSSDNKYVQYRLMKNQFSTTESDWQGVDDEPTAWSENLVKSSGVIKKISNISGYSQETSTVVSNNIYIKRLTGNTGIRLTLKDLEGSSTEKKFYLSGCSSNKTPLEYYGNDGSISPYYVTQNIKNGNSKSWNITPSSSVVYIDITVISSSFASGDVLATLKEIGDIELVRQDIVNETARAQQEEGVLAQRMTTAETNITNNKKSINSLSSDLVTLDSDIDTFNVSSSCHLGNDDAKFVIPQGKKLTLSLKNTSGSQFAYYLEELDTNGAIIDYINPESGEKSNSVISSTLSNNNTKVINFISENNCGFVHIINYGSNHADKTANTSLNSYYGKTISYLTKKIEDIQQEKGGVRFECSTGINIIPFTLKNQGRYIFKNVDATISSYISFKEDSDYIVDSQPRIPAPAVGSEKFFYRNASSNYIVFTCSASGDIEITDLDSAEQKLIEENNNKNGWVLEDSTNYPVVFDAISRDCRVLLKIKNNTNTDKNVYVQLFGYNQEGILTNNYLDSEGSINTGLTWVQIPANKTIIIPFTTPDWLNQVTIAASSAWTVGQFNIYLIHDVENTQSIYNNVEYNKDVVSAFIAMLKNKMVDPKYNRLSVVVHGDSILGSQLSEVTNAPDYNAGSFPPNMSRMIVARKFYDKYKFSTEDTIFRNLKHSDWTKTGTWNTNNGFDNTTMFNKPEVWSCEEGATAIIDVFGYKYVKVVWSEYYNITNPDQGNYSFVIEFSKDDFATIAKTETKTITSASRIMQKYRIFEMPYYFTDWQTEHYKVRITPTDNCAKAQIWGIEMWNNPRLDVTVEAFSGSTAVMHKLYMLDSYNSDYIKPHLIISDVLVTNDSDYINRGINYGEKHTISNWYTSYKTIFDKIDELGIPVLMFAPHDSNAWLVYGAETIPKKYSAGVIDIQKKKQVVTPESSITGQDGTHLSNYGVTYYFEELEKIFDN